MFVKHLQKYIDEFSNRGNVRQMDTMDQINATIHGLVGKRLKYKISCINQLRTFATNKIEL